MFCKSFSFSTILFLAMATVTWARLLEVPDQFETIQRAVDSTRPGDTVLVAPGRYVGTVHIEGTPIVLASDYLFDGNQAIISETIIDGADNSGRSSLSVTSENTIGTLVTGFTITGGGCDDYGGGIYCAETEATFQGLVVEENRANMGGGGIYVTRDAVVEFTDVVIRNNWGSQCVGIISYFGANTTLNNCVITEHDAETPIIRAVERASLTMNNCIFTNNRSTDGWDGVINVRNQATFTMNYCQINNNTRVGTELLHFESSTIVFDHVLITRNSSDEQLWYSESCQSTLTNLTVADNIIGQTNLLNLGGNQEVSTLSNSIVFGNEDRPPSCGSNNSWLVQYSLFEGGRAAFSDNWGGTWGEGNLGEDPLFLDRENGDYRLNPESPCLDAGDPEAEPDPDGSRRDIGAFVIGDSHSYLGGRIIDNFSRALISGALIEVNVEGQDIIHLTSSAEGTWGRWFEFSGERFIGTITISQVPYVNWSAEFDLGNRDRQNFIAELLSSVLSPLEDSILVGIPKGEMLRTTFQIQNIGQGPLEFTAGWSGTGSIESEPGAVIRNISLGNALEDDRLMGATFNGENYFISGANGVDESRVYVLDQDFALVRSFPQLGLSRYGMKDLEWDGELIWGIDDSLVCGFDYEGNFVRQFRTPHLSDNNIAYDPERQLYWISGATSTFTACDSIGNIITEVPRRGFNTVGLGWDPDAVDGFRLIALSYRSARPPTPSSGYVYGINPDTGDTIRIGQMQLPEAEQGATGLSLKLNKNGDGSKQGLVLYNVDEADGGDILQEIQIHPNREWLTLVQDAGQIAPGGILDFSFEITTVGTLSPWALETGEYGAEIIFNDNSVTGETRVPIFITVSPNIVPEPKVEQIPNDFGIVSAYPNPFNSSTRISYSVRQASLPVTLAIYDLSGRLVVDLSAVTAPSVTGLTPPTPPASKGGNQTLIWDASTIPAGVYFVRMQTERESVTKKVVLMR